jgi:hypothetical protein
MDESTQLKERVEFLEHIVDEHGKLLVRLSNQVTELAQLLRKLTTVVTPEVK